MNKVKENPGPPDLWLPFEGGLGDVLIRCYRTSYWHRLESADDRVGVLLASVNPFSTELFRWHINRRWILLQDLSSLLEFRKELNGGGPGIRRQLFDFAGIKWPGECEDFGRRPPAEWIPTFYAPDYQEEVGHLIFHPFAGLPNRSIDQETINLILEVLSAYPGRVFVPSRDFPRVGIKKAVHMTEDLNEFSLPPNITILRNLTVPATLNLIRQSAGFIGTQSSLVLCAAHEGISSLALYPDFLAENFREARAHASYARLDHMTCLPFSGITRAEVEGWLESIDPAAGQNAPLQSEKSRNLAEWVIRQGGRVGVEPACLPQFRNRANPHLGRSGPIRSVEGLPEGPFRVWRVDFAGCGGVGDSHLATLDTLSTGLDSLTNLNLSGTSISGSGMQVAGEWGKNLRHLHPPKGIETGSFAKKFPLCQWVKISD